MVGPGARSKIKEMLRQVAKDKGNMYLAMLVQSSPELPDRWSFVVSAPWIDSEGARAAISYLSTRLKRALNPDTLSAIDRISAIQSDQPSVQRLWQSFAHTLDEPELHMRNWQVGDWFIPEGFIFVADSHARTKSASQKTVSQHNSR